MSPVPRLRPHAGPALLCYGFRPFFLFGAIYAGAAVLVWLPMFQGELSVSTALVARDWHVHEMLYGYVAATVAGFLLTAIPNWTGRLPIQGVPLLFLVLLWVAGRVAVTMSARIGWLPAAVIDVAFLATVAAAAAREIMAGRNWGNLKVLGVLAVLIAGNVVFHLEAHFSRGGGLRNPHRHRGRADADHDRGRSNRSELHPQLAGARKSRPVAGVVRQVRRRVHCGRCA